MSKQFNYGNAASNLKYFDSKLINQWEDKMPQFYSIIRSVSSTGMSRIIAVYVLTSWGIRFLGEGRVRGCGMDMAWETCSNIMYYYLKSQNLDTAHEFVSKFHNEII